MKWFEVIEDLGDGSSATRRFRTKEDAELHIERNENYCYSGYNEVDTDSKFFFYDYEDLV